jgi:hypothetical protein
MNTEQKEEGTFKTIDANISKIYEYAGDKNLHYSEFKSTAGLEAVKDVDIKNVLKKKYHSYVANEKIYCLRKKKTKFDLFKWL